jgi:hypothetical protein
MPPAGEAPREPVRNALLRRVDWRFMLNQSGRPQTADFACGPLSDAARLAFDVTHAMPGTAAPGTATLVVLAHPSRGELRKARTALRPGGEVYCEWRSPIIAGRWRARRRLTRAGFADVRIYWRWPPVRRMPPQFWLPLDSGAALRQFLALRPPRSRVQSLIRRLWWAAVGAGVLAPLCVLARRPAEGTVKNYPNDELERLLPTPRSWLLLTGGHRSVNKVVGLPFGQDHPRPQVIVKFARVSEAERGLEREAEVLQALAARRPGRRGIPRVLSVSRRAGQLAVAETAIYGRPLLSSLDTDTFPDLALRVTRWLVEFVEPEARLPRPQWWPRLITRPLEQFGTAFSSAAGTETIERAKAMLDGLGDLPQACEHRDCSPWNIVLTDDGAPALLDWESAEPSGLPGLDLVYFLANAAFILEGALESGRTRETYARLLDSATAVGRVAAACVSEYCKRLELDAETFARLRLLCWIVHCQSEYLRAEVDAGGPPEPRALHASVFLGLVRAELQRLGTSG